MPRRRKIWTAVATLVAAAVVTWQAPSRVNGRAGPSGIAPPAGDVAFRTSPPITRGDSIVVFAAHPDDEVLGAGGLIHTAVAAGARVDVVFFTNGDGYLEGVDLGFRTLLSTPDRFVKYGRRRQREAAAAAQRLGLTPDHLTFLGYPDRGLVVLWGPAWACDHPYTSPFTRRSRSPYERAYHRGVAYCGTNLLEDVERVLRRDHPNIVITHHADDTHQDHWAAGAFVAAAIERLRNDNVVWAKTVRIRSYLVHHGRWPQPEAYAPEVPLTPPADVATWAEQWTDDALGPADEQAKRNAVLEYHSQVQLLRAYMLSFVRPNELFGRQSLIAPAVVESAALPIAAPEEWDRVPPVIGGTPAPLLVRATGGSLRVSSVGLAQDTDHLFIALRLRRVAIREAQYRVSSTLFYQDGHVARLRLLFRAPRTVVALQTQPRDLPLPAGTVARSFGPRVNIAVPLSGMGRPVSLLMHVDTVGPLHRPVERSPWVLVRLERGEDLRGADAAPAHR